MSIASSFLSFLKVVEFFTVVPQNLTNLAGKDCCRWKNFSQLGVENAQLLEAKKQTPGCVWHAVSLLLFILFSLGYLDTPRSISSFADWKSTYISLRFASGKISMVHNQQWFQRIDSPSHSLGKPTFQRWHTQRHPQSVWQNVATTCNNTSSPFLNHFVAVIVSKKCMLHDEILHFDTE